MRFSIVILLVILLCLGCRERRDVLLTPPEQEKRSDPVTKSPKRLSGMPGRRFPNPLTRPDGLVIAGPNGEWIGIGPSTGDPIEDQSILLEAIRDMPGSYPVPKLTELPMPKPFIWTYDKATETYIPKELPPRLYGDPASLRKHDGKAFGGDTGPEGSAQSQDHSCEAKPKQTYISSYGASVGSTMYSQQYYVPTADPIVEGGDARERQLDMIEKIIMSMKRDAQEWIPALPNRLFTFTSEQVAKCACVKCHNR